MWLIIRLRPIGETVTVVVLIPVVNEEVELGHWVVDSDLYTCMKGLHAYEVIAYNDVQVTNVPLFLNLHNSHANFA